MQRLNESIHISFKSALRLLLGQLCFLICPSHEICAPSTYLILILDFREALYSCSYVTQIPSEILVHELSLQYIELFMSYIHEYFMNSSQQSS